MVELLLGGVDSASIYSVLGICLLYGEQDNVECLYRWSAIPGYRL